MTRLVCMLDGSIAVAVLDSGREIAQSRPDHRRDVIRRKEEEEDEDEDLSQRILFQDQKINNPRGRVQLISRT